MSSAKWSGIAELVSEYPPAATLFNLTEKRIHVQPLLPLAMKCGLSDDVHVLVFNTSDVDSEERARQRRRHLTLKPSGVGNCGAGPRAGGRGRGRRVFVIVTTTG